MATFTYFFPEIIAKCGLCPYIGPKDSPQVRNTWIELNGAQDLYDAAVQKYIGRSDIQAIDQDLEHQCSKLTDHLNVISNRFLETDYTFTPDEIFDLIVNDTFDQDTHTKITNVINSCGLKTSQAFIDIFPTHISRSFAPVVLTGAISFSWLKDIDDLANEIKKKQTLKKDALVLIEKIIREAQDEEQSRIKSAGQFLGRFTTQKWKNMSQKVKCDRILYYSHVYAHTPAKGTGGDTFDIYQRFLDKINSFPDGWTGNPNSRNVKFKWNPKLGILESIDFPAESSPKPTATRAGKKKRPTVSYLDDPVKSRQLELMLLFLIEPDLKNVFLASDSINVSLLTKYIILASPDHHEDFRNDSGVLDLVTKAIGLLNDAL